MSGEVDGDRQRIYKLVLTGGKHPTIC